MRDTCREDCTGALKVHTGIPESVLKDGVKLYIPPTCVNMRGNKNDDDDDGEGDSDNGFQAYLNVGVLKCGVKNGVISKFCCVFGGWMKISCSGCAKLERKKIS